MSLSLNNYAKGRYKTMEDKVLVVLFYVARVFMALVGAFICWMWGYGIDNASFYGAGIFSCINIFKFRGK